MGVSFSLGLVLLRTARRRMDSLLYMYGDKQSSVLGHLVRRSGLPLATWFIHPAGAAFMVRRFFARLPMLAFRTNGSGVQISRWNLLNRSVNNNSPTRESTQYTHVQTSGGLLRNDSLNKHLRARALARVHTIFVMVNSFRPFTFLIIPVLRERTTATWCRHIFRS